MGRHRVQGTRFPQEPIIAGAKVIGLSLDRRSQVQRIQRLDASVDKRLSPNLELVVCFDELRRLCNRLTYKISSYGVRVGVGFEDQGVGGDQVALT